jgi:hypothetical protein
LALEGDFDRALTIKRMDEVRHAEKRRSREGRVDPAALGERQFSLTLATE